MGWFEKINLNPPSPEELQRPELSEVAKLEKQRNRQRQLLSEGLAEIYDEADELGINLDDGYEEANNESYQKIKGVLIANRADIAMLLETVEEDLEAISRLRGGGRSAEA